MLLIFNTVSEVFIVNYIEGLYCGNIKPPSCERLNNFSI